VLVAQEPFLPSGGTAPVGQAQFGMLETQLRELRFHEDAGCEDLKGSILTSRIYHLVSEVLKNKGCVTNAFPQSCIRADERPRASRRHARNPSCSC